MRTTARFLPKPEIAAQVLETGELLLTAACVCPLRYPPVATALWIALRRCEGDSWAAAAQLAEAWEASPELVHEELMEWVVVWCWADLLSG